MENHDEIAPNTSSAAMSVTNLNDTAGRMEFSTRPWGREDSLLVPVCD